MNRSKLKELYCKSNSRLTDKFNLGLGREYLDKLYDFNSNIVSCYQQFGVFPPIIFEGSEFKDDPVAEIFSEALKARDGVATDSSESYSEEISKKLQEHSSNVLTIDSDEDVPTIFRKSIINLTRELYYNNIIYLSLKEGLPQREEVRFIKEVEEIKQAGFVDIYSDASFTHDAYLAANSNLIQDVNTAQDILNARVSDNGGRGKVSEEKIKFADKLLEESREIANYVLGGKSFASEWFSYEDHRLGVIGRDAKNIVKKKIKVPAL